MNRKQRRNYAKKMNTPQKIENFSREIDSRLRKEYIQKSNEKISKFIESYTLLFAYVLDYELENEEHIRISARKNKNTSKQIANVIKYFNKKVNEHIELLDNGTISIEDIIEYFKTERELDFNFDKREIL